MSSTRHAEDNAPINQERYMSSPEYAELRGVMGNAATAKASILLSARKRSLIFFLQSLSLEKGGLKAVAESLYAMFPERIGTERIIAAGIHAGQKLSDERVAELRQWLRLEGEDERLAREEVPEFDASLLLDEWDNGYKERQRKADLRLAVEKARPIASQTVSEAPHDSDFYLNHCRRPEKLAAFLIDLCINPRLLIPEPGQKDESLALVRDTEIERFTEQHKELDQYDFKTASFGYFHDICGALFEFQKRHAEAAAESFAKTVVARKVHQTLDACLAARRMVLIEGESDSGKSTSAEAWCRMHKGEARFVRLQGVTNKTVFFRAIARALGVASSYMRTAKEMQARVEDVLQRSGLCLVLDESQYCFAQSERIYSRPELVDWIYTACCNYGVPVALIASPLFSKRLHQAERQTIWNSDQFKRRIYRYEILPPKPNRNDIELVAKHQLPEGDSAALKFLAGYAATATHPFTAIADTIADARQIAEAKGGREVTLKDLVEGVNTFRTGSELAKRQAFDAPRGKPGRKASATIPQASCMDSAQEGEAEQTENFTERGRPVAALKTPGSRATAPALSNA